MAAYRSAVSSSELLLVSFMVACRGCLTDLGISAGHVVVGLAGIKGGPN